MEYGWWHSDPAKAQEYITILDDALRTLKSRESLSASDAERIFPGLFRILCDEESETDYDDAWDTMAHLGPRHAAAVPVLVEVLMAGSIGRSSNAGEYAKGALRKIDRDGTLVREYLAPCLQDPDPKRREEAAETLKQLAHRPMRSFRLYTG